MISKSLASRLQDVMPKSISENQSAYVNSRFISEGRRLISDSLETTDLNNGLMDNRHGKTTL